MSGHTKGLVVGGDAICGGCGCTYSAPAWNFNKYDYRCTPCRRSILAEYRERRKAEGRPCVPGRMKDEYARRRAAGYYDKPEVRERKAAQMASYRKHPSTRSHHRAREMVSAAIASGALVRQPCEVCGATTVHAHHDDYSQPLDVRWLCPFHHREHHTRATEAQP